MAKTIKDLAKELNCSYEAVRKQTKRYAKELGDHIYMQHKTQYLDDFACDFIRSKRMDSPVVISRLEHDEAMELLKQKYTELLEKYTTLQEENHQLEIENAKIALLEADNKAQKDKIAEAEQKALEANSEAYRAKEELQAEKRRKLTIRERLLGRKIEE